MFWFPGTLVNSAENDGLFPPYPPSTYRTTLFKKARSPNSQGAIQYLRGQDEGGRGQKITVLFHAQGIKTVHAGEGVNCQKKRKNSVQVVVE